MTINIKPNARVLDACCGSRMFHFKKDNDDVIFMDLRKEEHILSDGRKLVVNPDIVASFTYIPFPDNRFNMVVFDPPHLVRAGTKSWLVKKYGLLQDGWERDIKIGFEECLRVLKPGGTLIFKWNEEQVSLTKIRKVLKKTPLFGNRRAKTHWLVFIK